MTERRSNKRPLSEVQAAALAKVQAAAQTGESADLREFRSSPGALAALVRRGLIVRNEDDSVCTLPVVETGKPITVQSATQVVKAYEILKTQQVDFFYGEELVSEIHKDMEAEVGSYLLVMASGVRLVVRVSLPLTTTAVVTFTAAQPEMLVSESPEDGCKGDCLYRDILKQISQHLPEVETLVTAQLAAREANRKLARRLNGSH